MNESAAVMRSNTTGTEQKQREMNTAADCIESKGLYLYYVLVLLSEAQLSASTPGRSLGNDEHRAHRR